MASFYTQVKIDRTWSALKSYALANNSFIRYDTITNTDYPYYQIFVLDGLIAYVAVIYTGTAPNGVNQSTNDSDKSDFETNYKNLTIVPQDPRTSDGYTKISGAGVAGTPNVGVVTVQGIAGGTAIPVSGTITATNPSVSTTGSAPPGSATYIGGSVTTAAPSYTTGQMNALSLTTAGLLRVDGSGVTQPVSGTVAATQSGTWTVQPGNTANTTPWLATISQGGNSATVTASNALKIDGSAVTQPVSGTVTANIGTSGSLALDATLTGGTQTTRITDGTNTATVKAASTAAVVGDKALVVAVSPNNTVAVAGTVTANIGTTNGLALDATLAKLTIAQSTALGSNTQAMVGGSVTTAAPTYTTGNINPLSLTTAGALRIDGSGVTQPVSGTVAATQSGTWTVQPGNTANTTPWLATISQGGNAATVTASNALKIDGSAVTQPVSGTVTSNQGTANTLANRWPIIVTDGTNTMPTGDAVARAIFNKITDGTNTSTVKAASTVPVAADPALVVSLSPNSGLFSAGGNSTTSFAPNPSNRSLGTAVPLNVDVGNNLQTRSTIITDEGSFRDDFIGSSLTTTLTGTVTFTNNSLILTGSGTTFTTQVVSGSYIKKTADSETLYAIVDTVNSDTSITLVAAYTGTTSSTTAVISNWATTTPGGGGGSITVSNSTVILAPGTVNGSTAMIKRVGDYLPYTLNFRMSISQRIANQTTFVGFQDVPGTPGQQACIVFDGTNNTTVKFRTSASSAAADIQETTVNLLSNLNTSQTLTYEIDLENDVVVLLINGTVAATHTNHLPSPYTQLSIVAYSTNAATVTATTIPIDLIFFNNVDSIQIANTFAGDPLKVQVISNAATALSGLAQGFIALNSNAFSAIRSTTYTEQSSNAQRSISSSSANDTAAGTGARTVVITYYTSTGTGPFIETVTLNGTANVNTVSTTICYIESIVVSTVGSTGSNVGTITLFAATAGGGGAIGTIAATANSTFWSHHYVQTGKTCYITGFQCNLTGSQSGSFHLRAKSTSSANAAEIQVSDNIRPNATSQGAGSVIRTYGTAIQVTGPARIVSYILPDQSITSNYYASFDFYEQ